ncbi:hypothetical protein E5676_scaffold332G001420 [Cucumis melo var. makuwa]|uniref:Uncharacterized protein n=1 Tax=Cucumis melo var. makuwa TaxID=1194695 RepID=A0A5A7V6J4_CUCMM|nr:hypothetical protein E6C27_scaffold41G00110 [Cucumis melo var. makuwa]TYK10824.1 hypothetical protein E5676_scaffold332G001420 [Cucumis melo var. makuwa]
MEGGSQLRTFPLTYGGKMSSKQSVSTLEVWKKYLYTPLTLLIVLKPEYRLNVVALDGEISVDLPLVDNSLNMQQVPTINRNPFEGKKSMAGALLLDWPASSSPEEKEKNTHQNSNSEGEEQPWCVGKEARNLWREEKSSGNKAPEVNAVCSPKCLSAAPYMTSMLPIRKDPT